MEKSKKVERDVFVKIDMAMNELTRLINTLTPSANVALAKERLLAASEWLTRHKKGAE
jgi:hypothetical protein